MNIKQFIWGGALVLAASLRLQAQSFSLNTKGSLDFQESISVPEEYTISPGQLSGDGLSLFFSVKTWEVESESKPAMMTRSSLGQPFGNFQLIKVEGDDFPYLTQPALADGSNTMVLVTSSENSWGNNDLVIGEFDGTTLSNLRHLADINVDGEGDAYPSLSKNAEYLYYIKDIDVYYAKKSGATYRNTKLTFSAKNISGGDIIAAWISPDEKTLVMSDGSALYVATRKKAAKPFTKSKLLFDGWNVEGDFVGMISFTPDGREMLAYMSGESGNTIARFEVR